MRAPAQWPHLIAPTLALLGFLHAVGAHASKSGAEPSTAAAEVCEFRTINYITHTLPQQCLRTSWTSPTPTAAVDNSTAQGHITTSATASAPTTTESFGGPQDNGTSQEQDTKEELAASAFMSFEEWKEMMLRKTGQDPANIKSHKPREHRERDPSVNSGDVDSYGEEGEISLDFDALAEKVSEITSPSAGGAATETNKEAKEEQIFYDDGKTQYYRSKDAGKTCKERFSYASFDAGATVLKTNPGAKNAKAILVENKDSYMLLECRTKNKFVIVELSDDILVDTVVLANFEFFSSMIRTFRVSVSDRYPVKLDKWVGLGTFEARNSRDIQAFLIEHPQIYTKYIRIEFLSHWGNEFYCPVSLLRVHGTRMLDTWKESNHDDEPEQIQASPQEPATDTEQVQEPAASHNSSRATTEEAAPPTLTEMGLTPWYPIFQSNFFLEVCELRSPTTDEPTHVDSGSGGPGQPPAGGPDSVTPRPSAASEAEPGSQSNSSFAEAATPEAPVSHGQSTVVTPSIVPSLSPQAGNNSAASHQSQKQPDGRADASNTSSSAATTTTTPASSRNKTSTVSSASASPTVQESFFKTISKRLQNLESNTSLSLQYIEEQSRFLQDVLLKMERKQITRVDAFLDNLNKTVLSELRNVRTQYDQIWQSTVLALETQREQSQREIVALTSRLNILADEVVFQKRMAILQSVLLLSCLVLVIFSRGGLAAFDSASFPAFPQPSSTSSSFYRRHGYAYGGPARSDSISALSMPDTSPPDPQAATDTASSTTLAASALPRHLYPSSTAPSSFKDKSLPLTPPSEYSRESTPARTTTTHLHLHRSPEPPSSLSSPFYEERDSNNNTNGRPDADTPPRRPRTQHRHHHPRNHTTPPTESGSGSGSTFSACVVQQRGTASTGAEISSIDTDSISGTGSLAETSTAPREKEQEEEEEEEEEQKLEGSKQPPGRTRTTLSQGGELKKPLPALPEDPS
ncbi:hypothetical protein N658DRAFT_490769 [Parathielavia hyrcaniae]|uniref:SUN domain-containing protein n=1 Tax=Parathielavia hyrcaniae TaxID=113614 RepID=A0AAN6QFA6_9PEZI|nr:hypothetical protein N658DRAFT_490769 [Parathielavia hyrcaniae]